MNKEFYEEARKVAESCSKERLVELYLAEVQTCCELEEQLNSAQVGEQFALKCCKEAEEQLANAVILEPDHYVIITNGWKNKKYGVARVKQSVQYNYIQETDGRLGSYVACIQYGKFATKEEAQAKLKEIQGE